MQRHDEQQVERPQRFGRLLRTLVGEPQAGAESGATDPPGFPPAGPSPSPGRRLPAGDVESRLRQLEHGVRIVAETLRRSHAELSAGILTLQRAAAAADGVSREEVRAMLGEALGPLSVSVERLAESVHGLPLVLSASNERLLDRATHVAEPDLAAPAEPTVFIPEAPAVARAEDAQPRLTSEDWSDGAWVNGLWVTGPRGASDDFPARPFDEAPDGVDGNGEWFWNEPGPGPVAGDPGEPEP